MAKEAKMVRVNGVQSRNAALGPDRILPPWAKIKIYKQQKKKKEGLHMLLGLWVFW